MASPRRTSPAQTDKHRDIEPRAPQRGELTPPGLIPATFVLVWAGVDGWWTIGEILSGRIVGGILFAMAGGLVGALGVAQWVWVVEQGDTARDMQRYAAGLFWLLCGSAGVAVLAAHSDVSWALLAAGGLTTVALCECGCYLYWRRLRDWRASRSPR